MTVPSLRLLLDQNFPNAPEGMRFELLDRTVTLEHFSTAFPDHAKISTEDWKVYLLARSKGFAAVVTSDYHQLSDDTTMIAAQVARIGVITWSGGEDDPVVLYGQLLTYMPQIVKQLKAHPSTVIQLPKAHLQPHHHYRRPSDITRTRDQRDGKNYPQRRAACLEQMRRGLSSAEAELKGLLPER